MMRNNDDAKVLTVSATSTSVFDKQSKSELLVHIQLLLSSLGLTKSADLLVGEIEEHGLIPKRYNVNGVPCPQTFEQFAKKNLKFAGNLMDMLKRLNELACQSIPPVVPNLPIRLFSSRRQAMDRRNDVLKDVACLDQVVCRRPVVSALENINITSLLMARQLGGQIPHSRRIMLRKESMTSLQLHRRIFGHLGPIFCVKFDVTGRYIFTGADDNLIKVWDARTCLLRFTFRGHTSYIMDMAVSPENNILASGAMDKTVRMWCLQRGKLLHVHKGHTASINTISFLPYMKGNTRYVVSAGSDCSVIFFRYEAPNYFRDIPPIKFNERTKPGSKLVSLCHSPGGNLVALGDTHQCIRLYQVSDNNVERLFEVFPHTDRVDSLIWSHKHLRFVSGSKDGTAKAWYIGDKGWCSTSFKVPRTAHTSNTKTSTPPPRVMPYQRLMPNGMGGYVMQTVNGHNAGHSQLQSKKSTYRVTMLCWTRDDDLVVSSGSDHLLRTWNWRTGDLLRVLSGHTDESFVLLAHPIYREYVLSVGHDAKLIVWNVYTGKAVKIHYNDSDNENNEKRAIFDMSISPDGTLVSFVDNYGNLSILGINSNGPASRVPREQFFNTDYRSFAMDEEGFVIDDLTGLAPENMDPPILVTGDGAPHGVEWQRRVPGNDLLRMELEPICPWVARHIVPALSETEYTRIHSEWEVAYEEELRSIDNLPDSIRINEINPEHCQLVPRERKTRQAVSHRNNVDQPQERLANPERSQYIIEDEDDSDIDPSYMAGEEETRRSVNSHRSSVVDDNLDEDELDSEYENSDSMIPSTSMRLRNGRNHRRYGRRFEDGDGTDSHGQSSDTLPVRRSSRRHTQNIYRTPTPEALANSRMEPIVEEIARRTRSRRAVADHAENIRKTSQSSKENVSTSNDNEDEPCCSKTISNILDPNENITTDDTLPGTSIEASASTTNTVPVHEEDSSGGEECHESDNTYKNESPSSHGEEEGVEDEEEHLPRSQRNALPRDYYSGRDDDNSEELSTSTSSSRSSPSSSSCYSSGNKARRIPSPKRRRVNTTARNAIKRKAVSHRQSESSNEAKRPRRAAANNALNRFRESSDFEDDLNGVQYHISKNESSRIRRNSRRRIHSSSTENAVNDETYDTKEPASSNTRLRSSQRVPKLLLPPRTRTGRRVIPTVRYCEDD